MTLLERWDRYWLGAGENRGVTPEEIRRALAIAQAVEERVELERAKHPDCRSEGVNWIMNRTDELLEGK